MALILDLPEHIEKQLQKQADSQALSPEVVALRLLQEALAPETVAPSPTPQEVVDKIKQLPPNPHAFRPAQGSLAEALENAPTDPDFDLAEWTKEWQRLRYFLPCYVPDENDAIYYCGRTPSIFAQTGTATGNS